MRVLLFSLTAIAIAVGAIVVGAKRVYVPIAALPPEATTDAAQGVRRLDLRFPCGDSECAGWLFLPDGPTKPGVVVMGHGFAGTRDVGLPFFAKRFARDGLAAFVFDYRHFGASGGAPRQLVDPWQQLDDWKAAIAFVRSSDHVDGSRIALWGSSLGGGLALVAGAQDRNIAAVVAQVPLVDTTKEGEATSLGGWAVVQLLLTGWGDLAFAAFGAEPITVSAIAPSGQFAMIADDAAFKAFASLTPGTRYRNEVAARSIFTFDDYNPAVLAQDISAPVLLIASRADRFASFAGVIAFKDSHANVVIDEIGGDHFDVYSGPRAEQSAQAASAFLVERLRAAGVNSSN